MCIYMLYVTFILFTNSKLVISYYNNSNSQRNGTHVIICVNLYRMTCQLQQSFLGEDNKYIWPYLVDLLSNDDEDCIHLIWDHIQWSNSSNQKRNPVWHQ